MDTANKSGIEDELARAFAWAIRLARQNGPCDGKGDGVKVGEIGTCLECVASQVELEQDDSEEEESATGDEKGHGDLECSEDNQLAIYLAATVLMLVEELSSEELAELDTTADWIKTASNMLEEIDDSVADLICSNFHALERLAEGMLVMFAPENGRVNPEPKELINDARFKPGQRVLAILEQDGEWHLATVLEAQAKALVRSARHDPFAYVVRFEQYGNSQLVEKDTDIVQVEHSPDEPGLDIRNNKECRICDREIPLTVHHLIPKEVHGRLLKKNTNKPFANLHIEHLYERFCATAARKSTNVRRLDGDPKARKKEPKVKKVKGDNRKNRNKRTEVKSKDSAVAGSSRADFLSRYTVSICRACHSQVHRLGPNSDLATDYNTLEKILAQPAIQKWARYASKQRKISK